MFCICVCSRNSCRNHANKYPSFPKVSMGPLLVPSSCTSLTAAAHSKSPICSLSLEISLPFLEYYMNRIISIYSFFKKHFSPLLRYKWQQLYTLRSKIKWILINIHWRIPTTMKLISIHCLRYHCFLFLNWFIFAL